MYTKPASFSTWVLRSRLRPLSSCSKHFASSDLPALGWHQGQEAELAPSDWGSKGGPSAPRQQGRVWPNREKCTGKHPGGKERQGSRKWVSFLSFLNCFSSSCDLEARRELQGYKTLAECAEEKLPLSPVAQLSGKPGG